MQPKVLWRSSSLASDAPITLSTSLARAVSQRSSTIASNDSLDREALRSERGGMQASSCARVHGMRLIATKCASLDIGPKMRMP